MRTRCIECLFKLLIHIYIHQVGLTRVAVDRSAENVRCENIVRVEKKENGRGKTNFDDVYLSTK
jgi:hypothetical protein